MTKKIILFLTTLFLIGCFGKKKSFNGTVPEGITKSIIIESEMLKNSFVPASTNQRVNIYLPPSYGKSDKRYSVIYYLGGFGDGNQTIINQKAEIDRAISTDNAKEFIFVEPSGYAKFGGSFYTNSPITGNWEDFIIKELIPYIDREFRTVANKKGRGLCGYSMGGTGTVNIGLKYPEMFNAFYAISPGILKDGDLDIMLKSWGSTRSYFNSYAAAASPNKSIDFPHGEIPHETYSDPAENARVIRNWYRLFGNQEEKVKAYKEKNSKIAGITIRASSNDSFTWIYNGTSDLHEIFKGNRVKHKFLKMQEAHMLPPNNATQIFMPYFSKYLE